MSARINDELAPTYEQLLAENVALKGSSSDLRRQAFNGRRNSHNCGPFQYSDLCESIIESTKVETPATSAALAAIEARFCGLLETYETVEPERFNPEFADLYAKIVNRIFSSAMDNPSVTDLESLTDYLDSSAENARAYADMSMKFHAEQQEAK
ncbi:hypothetical protein [Serratia sp. NPDC087055]|uniref:hypothetical protein n=1 Tax=Serratia sp. NPDC087055 TaxID=3364516 RepID=UPI00385102A2